MPCSFEKLNITIKIIIYRIKIKKNKLEFGEGLLFEV